MNLEDIVTPVTVSAFSAALTWLVGRLFFIGRGQKAIKLAVQSILRDRLYAVFGHCNKRGWTTMQERDNFCNMYVQYHSLGKNGVMDDTYQKFMDLPICDREDKEKFTSDNTDGIISKGNH